MASINFGETSQQSNQQSEQQSSNKVATTNNNDNKNIYLFNNNINSDFDIYDSDPNFQEYLKTKGINNKQAFNQLSYEQQETLSEKYVMGG